MATKLPDEPMSRNAGWSITQELFADQKQTIPFPMTGYTAKAQLRAGESQTSELLAEIGIEIGSVDPDTEVFSVDPDGNTLRLSLTLAQLAAITADTGYADVLIAAAGADPTRVFYFKAVIGDGETAWP